MHDTFKALKDKYAHLEFSILPLSSALKDNETKRLDSEYFKKEYLENEELLKRFNCQTLEELSTKITNGHTPYGENLLENEVKFITAEFIDDFTINEIKKFISMKSHLNYLKRSILNEGDIIFSIKGKIGNAVPIFDIQEPLNINQDVAKISLKNKINHFYVSAFLNSKYGKKQTEAEATGQINPFISLGVLKKIKIPLFDDSFQKDIKKIVKDSHHKLEQSKVLYKEAESLLYESLGIATSPLTQNTRILGESQSDSAEFNAESSENNPVIASETKQSINEINPHEVPPNLAPLRGAEKERKGGSSASALLELEADKARLSPKSETAAAVFRSAFASHQPLARLVGERGGGAALFAKKSDYANETNLKESRRIERAEPTAELESLTFSSDSSTLQNAQPKARQTHTTDALRLKFPHLNFSIKPLSLSLQKSGRLDSEYYQSKYENIEALIKSRLCRRLGDLVSIKKSIEPGSEAYQSEGIEFVRVSNLSKFGISKSDIYLSKEKFGKDVANLAPQKETILLSKDGSVGISYCVEENLDCITSGAILHLKVKDKKQVLPQVLSLILNSITTQLQAERDSGGSIIAHWKISEIENILIPLLDSQIQEQIASKLKLSFALKKEAKELLNLAKSKVESAIESKP